jgi:hypothetical protein
MLCVFVTTGYAFPFWMGISSLLGTFLSYIVFVKMPLEKLIAVMKSELEQDSAASANHPEKTSE